VLWRGLVCGAPEKSNRLTSAAAIRRNFGNGNGLKQVLGAKFAERIGQRVGTGLAFAVLADKRTN
jgi:hypothetical protein